MILSNRPYTVTRGFRSGAGLLILGGILAAGCDRPASTPSGSDQIQPSYDPGTGRLTRLSYDSNSDGKHDTWAFMDGPRLIKLEADENQEDRKSVV